MGRQFAMIRAHYGRAIGYCALRKHIVHFPAFIDLCEANGIDMDKYDIVDWELVPGKNGYHKGLVIIRTPEGVREAGSFFVSERKNDHSVYIKWQNLPESMYKDFLEFFFRDVCEDNGIPLNGYEIISMELKDANDGKVATFIVKTPTGEKEEGEFNVSEARGEIRVNFLPTQLPPSLFSKFMRPQE